MDLTLRQITYLYARSFKYVIHYALRLRGRVGNLYRGIRDRSGAPGRSRRPGSYYAEGALEDRVKHTFLWSSFIPCLRHTRE